MHLYCNFIHFYLYLSLIRTAAAIQKLRISILKENIFSLLQRENIFLEDTYTQAVCI